MVQRPGDGLAVGGVELIQQTGLGCEVPPQHAGRHGRHQRQRHQQAGQQGICNGQGQIGEQLLRQALHEHDRREHAHRGESGRRHRAQHLSRAGHRSLDDGSALGPQAVNVFDDHHRVVHQHTHRYGQAAEGDHVDGDTGEVHQHHRENDADGDGDQGDEGGPPVTQEQEQHHHREHRAPQQGREDGLHNEIDIVALIHQGHEFQAVVLGLQRLEPVGDVVGHLRRGVVGLLGKGQQDAVVAVELGVELVAVVRHHHRGHVTQRDGLHAVQSQVEQHHVLQLAAVFKLLAHRHHIADAAVVVDVPRWHGEVLGRQQPADGGDGQQSPQISLFGHLVIGRLYLLQPAFDLGLGLAELQFRAGHLGHTVHQLHQQVGHVALHLCAQVTALQRLHQLLHAALQRLQIVVQLLQRPIRVGNKAAHDVIDIRVLQHTVDILQLVVHLIHRVADRLGYAVSSGALGVRQRLLSVRHLLLRVAELALRLLQLVLHRVLQCGGQGVHLLLIQYHVGLAGQRAGHRDAGHAADALQLAGELIGDEVAEGVNILPLLGHRRHHDRDHGGIDLQHVGRTHRVGPLALQNRNFLLDVHTDGVHVHAVLELQHHHGNTVLRGGGNSFDAVQRGHGLLHGPRDGLLHGLGAGARVGGDDDHIGKVHVGQQIRCHPQIRHHTKHNNSQHHHEDGQRLLYAEFRHTPAPLRAYAPKYHNREVYHAAAVSARAVPENSRKRYNIPQFPVKKFACRTN